MYKPNKEFIKFIKIPEVFKNCIEIFDKATNGDIFKTIFPDLKVEDNGGSIYLHYPNGGWIVIDRDWWYAPYMKGDE